MKDKVYKLIELTGTSTKSIEDAVNLALKRAGKSIKNLSWFQIVETRGSIEKELDGHSRLGAYEQRQPPIGVIRYRIGKKKQKTR